MKRILLTAAMVAVSATALAGGYVDLRADWKGTNGNTVTSTVNTGTGGFAFDRARVGFNGSVGAVSGKAELDALYNSTYTPGTPVVKYAEITHKFADNMSMSFGKLEDTGMSGNEGMRSTGDMYFTSGAYMKNYFGGLRFAWNISDSNTLKVYMMNQDFNSTNSGTAQGYGLQYVGSAGDFGYVFNYHTLPTTVALQAVNGHSATYMTLGVNYKAGDWMIAFDYNMNTYAKQATTAAVGDATKNGMVLQVDWNMGNWVPQLKYESTVAKDLSTTKHASNDGTGYTGICTNAAACEVTLTQFSIGTEYRLNPADKFRYHLQYVSTAVSSTGTGATATNKSPSSTTVYAGFRWNADFLK